jgi:hypothetical protein
MAELDHRAWNDWLQEHLEMAADAIGSEIGGLMKKQADDIRAAIDELTSRLDAVEERLDALESGDNATRVMTLPKLTLKGGRDAA